MTEETTTIWYYVNNDFSISDMPVDNELVAAATASLQAQEHLLSLMRTKLKDNPAAKTGTYM